MSNLISRVDFDPKSINSGGRVRVAIHYTSDADDIIIVSEGTEFDARPGRISVAQGTGIKRATLTVTRQGAAQSKHCRLDFSLFPSSLSIVVGVE